jgi:hypothetical protein
MKFENTRVFNFEGALRGMRNPLNSWAKSDSEFFTCCAFDPDTYLDQMTTVREAWVKHEIGEFVDLAEEEKESIEEDIFDRIEEWLYQEGMMPTNEEHHSEMALIGPKDMELARKLIRGGSEHRKFLRQIMVSVDITAPLYW